MYMNTNLAAKVACTLLMSMWMAAPADSQGSPPYAIIDLIDDFSASATALTDSGLMIADGDPQDCVASFDQVELYLQPPEGASWTYSRGINELGQVVGYVYTTGYRAVAWQAGKPVLIIEPSGGEHSKALAINDLGDIVGYLESAEDRHPFLYTNGELINLGSFGGIVGHGTGVNDQRQVCGFSFDADLTKRAYIWQDGVMTDIGHIGEPEYPRESTDIDESGMIVGWAHGGEHAEVHAFVWQDGLMTDVHGGGPFQESWANANNDVGQVVGAMSGGGHLRIDPFYWDEAHGMRNLYDLIPPHFSKWDLMAANDINNHGQIVVQTTEDIGPVIATPFIQEFTLTDVSPAIAGEVNGIRAAGLDPGERVYFMYSEAGGGAIIPDCEILDAVMQIDAPTLIGAKAANAEGKATLRFHVPNAARNRGEILIQAVVPDSCKVSNLVVTQFE